MRIRRILAAVIATAALAGLGLTGAASAATTQGATTYVTPSQCRQGGGTPAINDQGNYCQGGTYNGEQID